MTRRIVVDLRPEGFDVVFVLDETSQFYVGFSAWTRPKEDVDDAE